MRTEEEVRKLLADVIGRKNWSWVYPLEWVLGVEDKTIDDFNDKGGEVDDGEGEAETGEF